MIPLCFTNPGEDFVIQKINGKDNEVKHLKDMGFLIDKEIHVIEKINDNMIVSIYDSRIALNAVITKNIYGNILIKEKELPKIKKFGVHK